MVDVVIIGAGVAGSFIARELARYELDIVIVDKENDVGNATSMANSAIIHAGYDAKAGLNKGKFNALGNKLYDKVCEELDVPFKRCGSLVIGFNKEDEISINKLYENGLKNNVPDMRILDVKEIREMEPNISKSVICALYAPSAGIISPWELTIALAENAVENGVSLKLNTTVTDIKKKEGLYEVILENEIIKTKYVINCAGVYADVISNMVAKPYFEIHPKKGQYFVLDKAVDNLVNHVIFQCPTEKGKGVLVTPSIHGNVLIGPDSEEVVDKEDLATTDESLDYIKKTAYLTCENIPFNKVIRTFVGLRASSSIKDFIIEEVDDAKGFINVAGYESPGLSSIPAVALYVVELLKNINNGLVLKEDFNPIRRKVIRFNELPEQEKIRMIQDNPMYGRVICRCEQITEAEIVDSIHRKVGATTVKGVKKRVRPSAGRCQGGFCSPRVVEILARELNKPWEEIPYDKKNAYILTEPTKSKG